MDETAFEALESILFGPESDEDSVQAAASDMDTQIWDTNEVEDALVEEQLSTLSMDPQILEADAFVSWISSINVCKNESAKSDIRFAEITPHGNSRDPPTRFQFRCGIGQCAYSSWDYRRLDAHQVTCQGFDKLGVEKSFQCPGCDKSYSTEASLSSHISQTHNFTPRPCTRCPDKLDVIYYDVSSLEAHQVAVHERFDPPRLCPLHNHIACTLPEKLYDKKPNLYSHLTNVHKLTASEIKIHIPHVEERVRAPPIKWECPLGNACDQVFNGKNRTDQRNHLKRKHKMPEDEALDLVPLSKAEKTSKKNRELKGLPPTGEWRCPVAPCELGSTFKRADTRRLHLVTDHNWTEQATLELIPARKKRVARTKKLGQLVEEDMGDEDD